MPRIAADNEEEDISPCQSAELKDLSCAATHYETLEHRVLDLGSLELPSPRLVLSFNNLTYSVKVCRESDVLPLPWRRCAAASSRVDAAETTKTLLDDISGKACNGEILAVLGASGSGKSTFIDALANRISKGSLKGTVTLNGEILQSGMSRVISTYVMQDDLLFPMLTVEETLMFAAEFRLPHSLPRSKKKLRVHALIDQLGLRNSANTMVGDEGHRGISGGEMRRVSIGIDIIHDPIILFLDEPTSGLDSTSAFMVVKVLKRIAESGSIVIMSIHQPSYRVLSLLDQLIILSRGQTVYSGSPASLPRFFSEFGHPIPGNENCTEFALDLIGELERSADGTRGLAEYNRKWQRLKLSQTENRVTPQTISRTGISLQEAISASISKGKLVIGATGSSPTSVVPKHTNPLWLETLVLSKRYATNMKRTPLLIGTRLATILITGFFLATLYWRLDDSPRGVQERQGFFAIAMSTMFFGCLDALPSFIQERYIFMRETAHNAYRRSSYVISHSLVTLPMLFSLSLAFAVVTFWAVGLDGGLMGFVFYFLIIFASFWCGNSFVTFISGIIPHVMLGYIPAVVFLAYFLLLSGFYINRDRIPSYWIWFHYISLIKYPYEAVMQNEFSDPAKCFLRGVKVFDNTPLAAASYGMKAKLLGTLSTYLGMNITESTCFKTGPDILKQQGISDLSKWGCLWVMVAWGFFFRILFYFSLLRYLQLRFKICTMLKQDYLFIFKSTNHSFLASRRT